MATKFREPDDEELEDESPDPAGGDDSDEEEAPAKKVVAKKKKAKPVEEDVEEEETERPAKKKVVKAASSKNGNGKEKEKVKAKSSGKAKKEREPRETNLDKYGMPWKPESMAGRVFKLANTKEGVPLTKVKAVIEKYKEGKKGGYWVITDIRKGAWANAVWKVYDDGKESGVLRVGSAREAEDRKAA